MSVCLSYGNMTYNLVNVYVPVNRLERSNYFQSVHQYFFPHSRVIVGGDFNCYDSALDKFGANTC